jgi:hypothetical protein
LLSVGNRYGETKFFSHGLTTKGKIIFCSGEIILRNECSEVIAQPLRSPGCENDTFPVHNNIIFSSQGGCKGSNYFEVSPKQKGKSDRDRSGSGFQCDRDYFFLLMRNPLIILADALADFAPAAAAFTVRI